MNTPLQGNKVDTLSTQNVDMKRRRVVNASDARDLQDYITLNDLQKGLKALAAAIKFKFDGLDLTAAEDSTQNELISNSQPTLILETSGATTKCRVFSPTADNISITFNLDYVSATWTPDDAAKVGYLFSLSAAGVTVYRFPVGGPIGLLAALNPTGLDLTNLIYSYSGSATTGIGVTPIYTTGNVTNQSGAVGPFNLTVGGGIAPAGQYRIMAYMSVRTAGGGTVQVILTWTDTNGVKTFSPTTNLTAGNHMRLNETVQTAGGSNITISTVYGATGAYDLDWSLERIS